MIKSYKEFTENLSLGDVGGMGAVVLPNQGEIGSGDVPAGRKKKKKKKKTKEVNEGNWKDTVEEIEISIDGLSVGEFAKAVVAALKTSYGDELSTRNKFLKVLNSII